MPRSRARFLGPLTACLAAVLLIVAGCRSLPRPGSSPDASDNQTIRVDGRDRTFDLHRPSTVDIPAPLVVMLHGGFGSGTQAESAYRWDDEADGHHFLVAYPDGIDPAWSVGGGCCGVPGSTGVDDVAFIVAMVDAIARQVPVDRSPVYATVISNGGLLAYRLACDTNGFAAIGPDSATLLGGCPDRLRSRSSTSTGPRTPASRSRAAPGTVRRTSMAPRYRTSSPPGARPTTVDSRR